MTCPPLYHKREEAVRAIRRLGYPWAQQLADYVDTHLAADERRAGTAHKGPQAYSAELQERLIAAIQPRTLHEPGCATRTLERIVEHGCETFGLKRDPDIATLNRAVTEARRRSAADLQAIRMRKVEPVTAFPSSTAAFASTLRSSFSTSTAST
jgi:hypothetical protein